MPKKCVEKLMKKGMSRAKAHKACYPNQKASSTKQEEQDKVMWEMAKSKNARTMNKLKRNVQRADSLQYGKGHKQGKGY